MKISTERLNQIIEEEVVKFKQLNEQVAITPEQKLVNEIDAFLSILVKGKKIADLTSLRDDIKRRAGA